ncbi:programmed cell death protein 7 [Battus philenor]|uniref:programmed cell death protein 7 n=1 Tax=Battus philenor TaxID=42288 RepID=UPI0035CF7D8D
MSNPNYYNNFRGSSFTFGNYSPILPPNFSIPPPPRPPPVYIPPPANVPVNIPPINIPGVHIPLFPPPISDQDFVRSFGKNIVRSNVRKREKSSISDAHGEVSKLVHLVEDVKRIELILKENVESLSDEDWNTHMRDIEKKKMNIKKHMEGIGDTYLCKIRNQLARRVSKRMRLKRVKVDRAREKEERVKKMEERSRKIEENLKKIKDDIEKTKQEAEAKLHADMVLKEVVRKKTDAKKFIVKLDALLRLRRARANTAKGRGDSTPENETAAFEKNIDKLKILWTKKLASYEKEESDLRITLKQNTAEVEVEKDKQVLDVLKKWRELLFGDRLPQVNFKGDIKKFVSVRSSWDQFACSDGSPLPLGWVIPKLEG